MYIIYIGSNHENAVADLNGSVDVEWLKEPLDVAKLICVCDGLEWLTPWVMASSQSVIQRRNEEGLSRPEHRLFRRSFSSVHSLLADQQK